MMTVDQALEIVLARALRPTRMAEPLARAGGRGAGA
jgi:hypothetical protein